MKHIVIKLFTAGLLLVIFFYIGTNTIKLKREKVLIAKGVEKALEYGDLLEQLYLKKRQMPAVGAVFAGTPNPTASFGCDIPGECPRYYERLAADKNKAFIAIKLHTIPPPNRVFVAFVGQQDRVKAYCGPWEMHSPYHLQPDMLPEFCNVVIKEVLGL